MVYFDATLCEKVSHKFPFWVVIVAVSHRSFMGSRLVIKSELSDHQEAAT